VTSTISVKVPKSVFFQLLYYYHLVTYYFHKFSTFGALLAPAVDRGPQVRWCAQQIRHFVTSPLLPTSPSKWFLAMENAGHSSKKHSIVCCENAAALKYILCAKYFAFVQLWCQVRRKFTIIRDSALNPFMLHLCFIGRVLQLVLQKCCYCRSNCDAWIRKMIGNSLVVAISFLKIRDQKEI